MAKKGMSERQYAAHAGMSRGAIQKAKQSGRLVMHRDGSIDAAASDRRRDAVTDPSQQRGASAGSTVDAAEGASFIKARTMNEIYKAQDRQLIVARKKGQLVDRSKAETLVFRLARQERDAWVNWPTRVAAVVAADLAAALSKEGKRKVAVDTAIVQRILDSHVRANLDSLSDLRVDLAG